MNLNCLMLPPCGYFLKFITSQKSSEIYRVAGLKKGFLVFFISDPHLSLYLSAPSPDFVYLIRLEISISWSVVFQYVSEGH